VIGMPLTPTLSPPAGRGRKQPLSPHRRGERGTRASGRVRGRAVLSIGALVIVALPLALAGCGKRNAPEAPPDVPNTYPRSYPSE
jgi:predicted small lipoprotein YifL